MFDEITLNNNISEDVLIRIKQHLESSFQLLDVANLLLENGYYNSFQNRLYYACYNIVKPLFYLYECKGIDKNISNHGRLRGHFNRCFIKPTNRIFDDYFYDILDEAFDRRQEADYRLATFKKSACEDHLVVVKHFVETIEKHILEKLERIGISH